MKKRITISALTALLAAGLLFAGCSKRAEVTATPEPTAEPTAVGEATPTPTAAPSPTPTAEPTPTPEVGFTNPLTGEPLNEDISALRPIACILNNHSGALPQCGISSADIIYEFPEEGITRMMAVYAQMPDCDRLGSVRSTRPYQADVAMSYDSIFVHWGRSDRAANFLYNQGLDHIELNEAPASSYSYRDYAHGNGSTEHTGFVKTEQLQKLLTDLNWRTEHEGAHGYGFTFAQSPSMSGSTAEKLTVFLAGKITNFQYDASRMGYTMAEYGVAYTDGDTNITPAFRNVMVLRAVIYDETSLASMELTNTSGTGTLFCDGKSQEFTWKRGDYGDNFEYFNTDGTPLVMGVGKTYICVVSTTDTLRYE